MADRQGELNNQRPSGAAVIFLDIDGVLHHQDGGEVLWPECIERINTITSTCNVDIVITSSWRLYHDWKKFNDMFAGRVIGATPVIKEPKPHKRYWEVLAWRKENDHSDTPWLAIDDLREMYPPLAPVHVIDGETAITDKDVSIIIRENPIRGLTG